MKINSIERKPETITLDPERARKLSARTPGKSKVGATNQEKVEALLDEYFNKNAWIDEIDVNNL